MTRTPKWDDFKAALVYYQDYRKAVAYEKEVKFYNQHGVLPDNAEYVQLVRLSNGATVCKPK